MAAFKRTELDLVGLARQDNQAAIQLFAIRDGTMVGRDVFLLDASHEAPDEEVLSSFLEQFYARATSIPPQVLVPFALPDAADLEAFLARRRGGPVHLSVPQRGERRELMALATRNAAETLAREQARWLADQGKTLGGARGAGRGARAARAAAPDRVLRHLERPGLRFGRHDGRLRGGPAADRASTAGSRSGRSSARTTSPRTRRCCGAGSAGRARARRAAEEALRWAMPDLVIIDGGKGQVSAAKEVLDELGLHDLPLAGLAKEREELFLPGRHRAGRPAADVAGALPGPAVARRGPPLRDHVPPRPALEAPDPLGVRRPAGRRPEAAAGAAAGLRLGEAGARGAGRADRGGARHRRGPRGTDQGDARGLDEQDRARPWALAASEGASSQLSPDTGSSRRLRCAASADVRDCGGCLLDGQQDGADSCRRAA